jgi:hypothetical protein
VTLTEKFLLLFSAYREALDRITKAEDEARFERGRAESLAEQLAYAYADSLARERTLSDRLMRIRHGERSTLTDDQIAQEMKNAPERRPSKQVTDVRDWQQRTVARFDEELEKYSQKVNG